MRRAQEHSRSQILAASRGRHAQHALCRERMIELVTDQTSTCIVHQHASTKCFPIRKTMCIMLKTHLAPFRRPRRACHPRHGPPLWARQPWPPCPSEQCPRRPCPLWAALLLLCQGKQEWETPRAGGPPEQKSPSTMPSPIPSTHAQYASYLAPWGHRGRRRRLRPSVPGCRASGPDPGPEHCPGWNRHAETAYRRQSPLQQRSRGRHPRRILIFCSCRALNQTSQPQTRAHAPGAITIPTGAAVACSQRAPTTRKAAICLILKTLCTRKTRFIPDVYD